MNPYISFPCGICGRPVRRYYLREHPLTAAELAQTKAEAVAGCPDCLIAREPPKIQHAMRGFRTPKINPFAKRSWWILPNGTTIEIGDMEHMVYVKEHPEKFGVPKFKIRWEDKYFISIPPKIKRAIYKNGSIRLTRLEDNGIIWAADLDWTNSNARDHLVSALYNLVGDDMDDDNVYMIPSDGITGKDKEAMPLERFMSLMRSNPWQNIDEESLALPRRLVQTLGTPEELTYEEYFAGQGTRQNPPIGDYVMAWILPNGKIIEIDSHVYGDHIGYVDKHPRQFGIKQFTDRDVDMDTIYENGAVRLYAIQEHPAHPWEWGAELDTSNSNAMDHLISALYKLGANPDDEIILADHFTGKEKHMALGRLMRSNPGHWSRP